MHKESIQTVFTVILTENNLKYSIDEGFFILKDYNTGRLFIMNTKNKKIIYQAMLLCSLKGIKTINHSQDLLKYIMDI